MKKVFLMGALVGGAIGAGVTYAIMVKKTVDIIREVEADRKVILDELNAMVSEVDIPKEDSQKDVVVDNKPTNVDEYKEILTDNDYSDEYEEDIGYKKDPNDALIYAVTEDEFYSENVDYESETLIYYEDTGVLTDENDEPIEEPYLEKVIGEYGIDRLDSMKVGSFIHVVNNALGTKYEILKEGSQYEE